MTESQWKTELVQIFWFTSKTCTTAGLVQAKAGSQRLHLGLPNRKHGPRSSTWEQAITCCFPRCTIAGRWIIAWFGLGNITYLLLIDTKAGPEKHAWLGKAVLTQQMGHIMWGHSTHQNVEKPDLGANSIWNMWTHFRSTASPSSLL